MTFFLVGESSIVWYNLTSYYGALSWGKDEKCALFSELETPFTFTKNLIPSWIDVASLWRASTVAIPSLPNISLSLTSKEIRTSRPMIPPWAMKAICYLSIIGRKSYVQDVTVTSFHIPYITYVFTYICPISSYIYHVFFHQFPLFWYTVSAVIRKK